MIKVLLINGPNLNRLGLREPEIYGKTTLKEIEQKLSLFFKKNKIALSCFQSNSEGKIIDFIQDNNDASAIIINPAAYSHYSIAIKDALIGGSAPYVEVHISNIYNREAFRHKSIFSDKAKGVIIGCGVNSYNLAALQVLDILNIKEN